MSKSARSLLIFSIYLFALGAILVLIPNVLLGLVAFPETGEVWIRVVGVLVIVLGFYYYNAAISELKSFFRASVYGRAAVLVFLDFAKPMLILFGAIDALAALWTHLSLRSEKQA